MCFVTGASWLYLRTKFFIVSRPLHVGWKGEALGSRFLGLMFARIKEAIFFGIHGAVKKINL